MILKRMLFEGRFTRPDLICGSSHPGEFIVPSTRRPAAKAGLLEERRLEIVVRRLRGDSSIRIWTLSESLDVHISTECELVCGKPGAISGFRTSDRIGNLKRDAQQQIVKTAPPVV